MKLALDEKKIRKGRPIGLPYVGSKKKISKKIVEIIKQNFGTEKTVYDVFGGGGAVTAELMISGIDVVYNDADINSVNMFKRAITQDREWIKTLLVSRYEFSVIKNKENKTVDDYLKLLINSFSNNNKNYIYSKKWSDIKYQLAVDIINNHDTFSGYKQTETYKSCTEGLERLQQLERLQKLEQIQKLQQLEQIQKLQQLEQLQQVDEWVGLEFKNKDYHDFSNVTDSIIYLDPPYKNTYNESYNVGINHNEFEEWCIKMAKNNIVIISGYEMDETKFDCVYEFKSAKSTFANRGKKKGDHCEKLFMVKK